jgi:hypothetical protein
MKTTSRRDILRRGGFLLAASQLSGLLSGLDFTPTAQGQDAREQLGTGTNPQMMGAHPLLAIEAAHPAALKPEYTGVHPRIFVTDAELETLRQRSRTTHRDLWQRALSTMISPHEKPAPAPAQGRRSQNSVGLSIAEAAFVYRIEQDPKYLALAKKFMEAAASYDIWGYKTDKPNVDLGAGHLLYGMSCGYDLLYHELTDAEREKYQKQLIRHATLLFNYYPLKPKKTFTYSQNHLFIPAAGLGFAAYALYGEVPEAADWAKRVRALYDRVLATYSIDGYYYEGFEYFVFATPWLIHYLDALAHATGEDLYDHPGLKNMYKYAAYSMLPDGKNVFDFGDVFDGPLTRTGQSPEYQRTHPDGKLHSNFNLLYRLAQRFNSGEAQGVAQWLDSLGQHNAEDYWSLVWYDPDVKPIPIEQQPTMQYFSDHDVVYWRSSWDSTATALAFKCGPPEGHYVSQIVASMPDWRMEPGHVHPDNASFILYGDGQYLSGVSGYAGVPMTDQSNTLLVDNHGQVREGSGHNAFDGCDYQRLNKIRILQVKQQEDGITVESDATLAYEPDVGIKSFRRSISLRGKEMTISDSVETESPHTLSILFHFDGDGQPSQLQIDVEAPKDALQKLEPNMMTGPGDPGQVDKGTRQQRGTRLRVSTPEPVTDENFKTVLRW